MVPTLPSSAFRCIWRDRDFDIVHQNNNYIADANYWSHLGADLCFDRLFKTYLNLMSKLCLENLPPTSFPILKHAVLLQPTSAPCQPRWLTHRGCTCQAIVFTVIVDNSHGLHHLANVPVRFGDFGNVPPPTSCPLLNYGFPCYAQQILQFSWALYSFHGGHFASTIQSWNLPFCIFIACNLYKPDACSFRNLHLAVMYSAVPTTWCIISGRWGTGQSSMATWFTLLGFKLVKLPQVSGKFRLI